MSFRDGNLSSREMPAADGDGRMSFREMKVSFDGIPGVVPRRGPVVRGKKVVVPRNTGRGRGNENRRWRI
jgi:hypothetical protein